MIPVRENCEKKICIKKEAVLGYFPDGTLNIEENGNYDVKQYSGVKVEVPRGAVLNHVTSEYTGSSSRWIALKEATVVVDPDVTTLAYLMQNCQRGILAKKIKFVGGSSNLSSLNYIFQYCYGVRELDLSDLEINSNCGLSGSMLAMPDLEVLTLWKNGRTSINQNQLIQSCNNLRALVIPMEQMFRVYQDHAFGTPNTVTDSTCLVYVPDNLVETYKADAEFWGAHADQIKPMSEFVE